MYRHRKRGLSLEVSTDRYEIQCFCCISSRLYDCEHNHEMIMIFCLKAGRDYALYLTVNTAYRVVIIEDKADILLSIIHQNI